MILLSVTLCILGNLTDHQLATDGQKMSGLRTMNVERYLIISILNLQLFFCTISYNHHL